MRFSFRCTLIPISEPYMSDLLHNAALFVALLWAPLHFYWPTSADERRAWTSGRVKETVGSDLFVLLADNTELVCESSGNLILQSFLYSAKMAHLHSIKLFTICSSRRRIVWRAPLFGGVTKEITGMERFLSSAEFAKLDREHVRVCMFTDRGFRDLPLELQNKIHLLTPGLLDERHSYPQGHSVWKQVRCSLLLHILALTRHGFSGRKAYVPMWR